MDERYSIKKDSLEYILGQWTERFIGIEKEIKKHNGMIGEFSRVIEDHTRALVVPIENKGAISALQEWCKNHDAGIFNELKAEKSVSISRRNAIIIGILIATVASIITEVITRIFGG